jgi:competence protein CoiA
VTASHGGWRADVLATSPDGSRTVAWEAQLAYQHDDYTVERTAAYTNDGIEVVWVFDRSRPQHHAPAIQVTIAETSIVVAGPTIRLNVMHCASGTKCARYHDLPDPPPCPGHERWEPVEPTLDRFVASVCTDSARWTPGPQTVATATSAPAISPAWTTTQSLHLAHTVREAQKTTDAAVADERARRSRMIYDQLHQQELDRQRHEANVAAFRERQEALTPLVIGLVTSQAGQVPWATGSVPEYAMGVAIIAHSRVEAVVCPIASRITPYVADEFLDATIYVASDHEKRSVSRRCNQGQRIVVLSPLNNQHQE